MTLPLAFFIPSWSAFSQGVLSGLSFGCIYALVALGFVVIANVTGVYNFAQGDYVMVGGMVLAATQRAEWTSWIGVPLAVIVVAGVALVQERFTVAPVRKANPLTLVVGSLGFGIVLEGVALIIWGKDPLSASQFKPGYFEMLGAFLAYQSIWIWCTTVVLLVGTAALFRLTPLGRAMRACAINPVAARLLGIRIGRLSMVAFVLAGAMSGLVGAVTVPQTGVQWNSGLTYGLTGFIAAALAGFTRPVRAVAAGLALGVVEGVVGVTAWSNYGQAIVFGVLIVYLFFKDLFGDDGVIRRLLRRRAIGAGPLWRPIPVHAPRTQVDPDLVTAAETRRRPRLRVTPNGSIALAALALAALSPLVLTDPAARDTMVFITLFGMGATGLGLIMGLAGQFSLGQGAMYLLGGYAASILTAKHGWDPIAGLIAGTLLAAVAALVIGWLTIRLRGFNLAIATLAVQLILLDLVVQFVSVTGGPLGTTGVPALEIGGLSLSEPTRFFYVGLVLLTLCIVVARNITRSRIGRSLRAISADEDGAQALGVNAARNKLIIFVVGAAMAGLGGALWAYYLQYAAPSNWNVELTINLITYVIVGGIGSVYGPLVGTFAINWMLFFVNGMSFSPSLTGGGSKYTVVISGGLLVLFTLFFRDGITETVRVAVVHARAARVRGHRRTDAAPAPVSDSSQVS